MILDKRIIKYANRVKDLNRQYEMNNNCDLDNGVYNKFVNQSSSGSSSSGNGSMSEDNDEDSKVVLLSQQSNMLDFKGDHAILGIEDDMECEQNSLVTSMNGCLINESDSNAFLG